jgi:hypothetical protein
MGDSARLLVVQSHCPVRKRKAGRHGTPPGKFAYEASTAKASRQSPIIVRLGTDYVNPFRQQIYKSLVSVALKAQNRTGCSSTGGGLQKGNRHYK